MKPTSLFLVLIMSISVDFFAQSPVIWTVNGDSILTSGIGDYSDTSSITISYKNKRDKWTDIDRQDVFSIKIANENVYYVYRPLFDGDRNLEDMKLFIDGNIAGYKSSTLGAFCVGFAAGSLSMCLPPDNLYVAPLFPLTAVICIGKYSGNKAIALKDDNFTEGYRQRRKSKNIKSAIWGGLSGLAVGVTGSFFIYGWGLK